MPRAQAGSGRAPAEPQGAAWHGSRSVGLDVARSLAILLVLASHCGDVFAAWFGRHAPPLLSLSGFFGVELFFVLSGFLIGRLLLEIVYQAPGREAWLIFMIRRWMRTLPLYFLWIAVLAAIWRPRFWVPGYDALWHDLPWYLTFSQNLAWPMVDTWFGVSWSLAVEEWFYLLFSALIIGGAVLIGRRPAIALALGAFLVIPAILRWQLGAGADWDAFSKITIYRLDAIAFGVATAWISVRRPHLLDHPLLLLAGGVLMIAAIWTGLLGRLLQLCGPQAARTFVFDATSIAFAMCLPAAAALQTAAPWISAPMRAVSSQSYAMYVMHLSILEMVDFYGTRTALPRILLVAATALAIWGSSYASYRFFEAPILKRRPRQRGARSGATDAIAAPLARGFPGTPGAVSAERGR